MKDHCLLACGLLIFVYGCAAVQIGFEEHRGGIGLFGVAQLAVGFWAFFLACRL